MMKQILGKIFLEGNFPPKILTKLKFRIRSEHLGKFLIVYQTLRYPINLIQSSEESNDKSCSVFGRI